MIDKQREVTKNKGAAKNSHTPHKVKRLPRLTRLLRGGDRGSELKRESWRNPRRESRYYQLLKRTAWPAECG